MRHTAPRKVKERAVEISGRVRDALSVADPGSATDLGVVFAVLVSALHYWFKAAVRSLTRQEAELLFRVVLVDVVYGVRQALTESEPSEPTAEPSSEVH